ncbi:disease resistance-like protein DSC1 [Neltuma alba]|uniref:disease resistance-like protein DSC1 n=1 Tax=Neltuma alba TaxID=207710 RepID=UPI0010A58D0B|nr:disease resistance-like protein DSC1 [Prosopis alba]
MASSSSSTPSSQSPKKYDVFISFRGEDTRFNFTSHLHEALRRNHVDTYIDYRLEKGDEVWPSLEKAIEDSTLFLVIFSKNYASSTWTLKELSKILDCSKNQGHQLVMPVFYRVDPSHVRKQSGSYQKAFEEHELKSINNQHLHMWRKALTHAANLSGWHCSFDRDEAELIKEIVKCVIHKLGCNYQSEDYLKDLIGIQKRMADVESLLEKDSNDDVRFIGIWAMGGMGKTTLAKALFSKLRFGYEGSYFLANVREESKKCGIDALREKLILNLLGDKESHIDMVDGAISSYAMRRLSRKKSFVVLDDVDDLEQLEKLAGKHDWFGPGSKILITTRDKQVFGKEVDDIYQLEALNSDEAFQLFSLNAFKKHYDGDPKIRELVEKITHYAGGNPLALKVLGSFLYGKNQEAWQSQLEKLTKLPCPKINDILKLSLEELDSEEKSIFLHISCLLNYCDAEDIKNLLDACGYSTEIGLMRLEDKALLEIHERRISGEIHERKICMHHLIKEMGQQIVREESLNDPKRCNILWISKKNSDIVKKNMGSAATEGIILNLSEVEEMCFNKNAFRSMPNLKFLCFDRNLDYQFRNKLNFPCGIEFLPKNLRLLHWVGYPLKALPAKFEIENLVQIIMPHSNLTKLWDGVQNLVNLRGINLHGSKDLIELPNFSKAIHLAEVNLNDCSKLQGVHPSILSLNSLCYLRLRGCEALTNLTSNTHLQSLEYLDLTECSRLNKFSVTSENSGFELILSGTAINDELCSSSGRLSKIGSLFLDECKSVKSLPYKLVDLRNLGRLDANGCNKVASNLLSIFDEMRALEVLYLNDCSESFEVPDNISLLSSLRTLSLSRSNIETLPSSIKHLSSLKELNVNRCERLRSLPELPPSILDLSARDCLSLVSLQLPLMREDGEQKEDQTKLCFAFTSCMKLDQQSIKACEAKVVHEISKATCCGAYVEYPGERVPDWFMYRSIRSSVITVDLRSIPQPWDGCFIFCVVILKSPPMAAVDAKCFIDGQYACTYEGGFIYDPLLSDHVVIWYDACSCGELQRKIEEKKRDAHSDTYIPLLQIQFTVAALIRGEIKECGVCPTSALLEYQNYIQQIRLPLHPHPSSDTMQTPSRKRKYHSLLR